MPFSNRLLILLIHWQPQPDVLLPNDTTLDGINPEHHVPMVVSDVLDVECVLPSVKFIESTLATSPGAFNAILRHLENLLTAYTDHIISSSNIIRYGDLNLLPMVRLATIVHSSGFMHDQGQPGHYCSAVRVIIDRLLESWSAICLVRYFEEVLGRSVDLWWRKTSQDSRLGDLWLRFDGMWKKGINSLVESLRAGRTDVSDLASRIDCGLTDKYSGYVALQAHAVFAIRQRSPSEICRFDPLSSRLVDTYGPNPPRSPVNQRKTVDSRFRYLPVAPVNRLGESHVYRSRCCYDSAYGRRSPDKLGSRTGYTKLRFAAFKPVAGHRLQDGKQD